MFYKSDTVKQNEINISDITLTFVSVKYPDMLMKHLTEDLNLKIKETNNGIYYINKAEIIFPIQIILTSKLNSDENLWIKSLTNNLTSEYDVKKLINEYEDNQSNNLYESVMDIIIKANKLEDCDMSVVLDNWLESLKTKAINEGLNKGIMEGRLEGIEIFIIDALEDGKSEEIIISKLMRHYKLSENEAKEYFDKYALVSK